jgi:hypothetical protein
VRYSSQILTVGTSVMAKSVSLVVNINLTMATSKSRRGFAAMPKEKQRAIARKGGENSHSGGRKASHGNSKGR